MIGTGWFKTKDIDGSDRRTNRDLMNKNAELYEDMTDAMKKANNDIKKDMNLIWQKLHNL